MIAAEAPATKSCVDFCKRTISCAVTLCNEDSKSTQYTAFEDVWLTGCAFACQDQALTGITSQQWTCMFSSSCRQAFDADYDTCNVDSHYTCM